ncbi:hypothetical protein E6C76_06355 [Pseudothauera nasutitermitis]|uniref:Uncharacterized protein n=1 Tax=Pseudothauera nasutitermitis TaxID=2565930 RepID=A0A4S4B1W4_9RHOO|nr:hypothetical protein E6C76_06355 [Pseudothauera nasutitermitis]
MHGRVRTPCGGPTSTRNLPVRWSGTDTRVQAYRNLSEIQSRSSAIGGRAPVQSGRGNWAAGTGRL